ncbi:hypothetical protein ACPA5B_11655 [Pseudomonas solani]|uniref:hypothetical protein n=1 Tax=Pseudomonas solani TaxID=2731552 RepID=UPI003C2C785B
MATKIKALRQFSHYHLGTVDADEVRSVRDDIAEALVGMELAEVVEEPKEEKKSKGSK